MNAASTIFSAERRRLRVSDFELLFEAGALADVRRAELIDGDIYGTSPQTTRHARTKMRLALAIRDQLAAAGSGLEVIVEVSVVVTDQSVPMPGIVVTGYRGDRFVPADTVALVVEVSTTTLSDDLGRKAELYAAAGIPEYWVVDVENARVVLHHAPEEGGYACRSEHSFGNVVTAVTIGGLSVDTASLLPT